MFLVRVSDFEFMSLRGHFDPLIGHVPRQEHCEADDRPQKGKVHTD